MNIKYFTTKFTEKTIVIRKKRYRFYNLVAEFYFLNTAQSKYSKAFLVIL